MCSEILSGIGFFTLILLGVILLMSIMWLIMDYVDIRSKVSSLDQFRLKFNMFGNHPQKSIDRLKSSVVGLESKVASLLQNEMLKNKSPKK